MELGWETDLSFPPRSSPSTSILYPLSSLLSSLHLCAFAPLRFFLLAFFLLAFLLRSRVRSNNRSLELLVYNRIFALSVLGLCCPRTLHPSTSCSLCDSRTFFLALAQLVPFGQAAA